MAKSNLERKFEGLESEPLFPEPRGRRAAEGKRKPPKNIGRAECPLCGKFVPIYAATWTAEAGSVSAYRPHFRITEGGIQFPCRMNDRRVTS